MGSDKKNITGTILRVQRMSTEDGPGIRSTVFFKGCPLACLWCHNPESISPRVQIHWEKIRCIGCHSCSGVCTKGALTAGDCGIVIDRSVCDSCGACVEACPSAALDAYGEMNNPPDLVHEVLKDKAYFQSSGGGVTLSGGEPTMQPTFARELLSLIRKEGVPTALDTSGQCSWETLASLAADTDLVLYDLKEIDPDRHKIFTGQSNDRILQNIIALARLVREHGRPRELWIRTPLIPGYTATPENIRGIGAFIQKHLEGEVRRWELCTFNNLCIHKYESLEITWGLARTPLLSADEAQYLATLARESGVDPAIVSVSGPQRVAGPNEATEDETPKARIQGGAF
jgi:pyruvate formate lyase activating enzyme